MHWRMARCGGKRHAAGVLDGAQGCEGPPRACKPIAHLRGSMLMMACSDAMRGAGLPLPASAVPLLRAPTPSLGVSTPEPGLKVRLSTYLHALGGRLGAVWSGQRCKWPWTGRPW